MKNKKRFQIAIDDDQNDLNQHGVPDPIPKDGEYYTLDLKRGDYVDADDIPEVDIADKDPSGDNLDEPIKSSSYYEGQLVHNNRQPHSSNAGGPVDQNDIFDQDSVSGVAGEPGGRIDEDTG